ncbi:Phosphoribosylaminoimidazole-succinocarboxamide synthase [Alloiococcus otitis]|uniref:phosphoribosylaminoimidazolesuccinocarboxamide synthase n=1 Tax=Alloiococcus otitis ATCC 51267 TaxID=883081 RepID=K9EUS6_9LACT|nr:phosphoribosylaminoimidazolesuccinocarboxamide synthase [Alloiococcus otitis]EKU92915.1 phosphoribosylaminoimidazolesuccinocarboxamide synthase [Alloiococcus otitis ATCC 51267]SUU80426.1 Phosphoribosylaminoimidazole-succinocarboxamide synthase [Alloiococcus otitis]
MALEYKGKTKDVYSIDDEKVRLIFKDDMTGKDGKFDPGENQADIVVEGAGASSLALTTHFFQLLDEKNIPSHYISSNLEEGSMDVRRANIFGKGLEIICRFKATGSFLRRYDDYISEGDDLDAYTEVSLKNDEKGDPFISKEGLIQLGILTGQEYDQIINLTKQISRLVKEELAQKGLELYDIKLEFGRDAKSQDLILIDEISGGNMRVYKDGQYLFPLDINQYVLNGK